MEEPMIKIVGIDYSMTCPCICVFESDVPDFDINKCTFHFTTDTNIESPDKSKYKHYSIKEYSSNEERFFELTQWSIGCILGEDNILPCHTMIEGYAMGGKGKVFHIGENTGYLKIELWRRGIKFDIVEPTVVKKYATGKGNSTKDIMHEEFVNRYGINLFEMFTKNSRRKKLGSPEGDIVDSAFICSYACNKMKETFLELD